jgi:hypothetical protein
VGEGAYKSHVLDEIEDQKSEDLEDENIGKQNYQQISEDESSSSEDDDDPEREERQMLQYLRHKIRLEVEKNIFALIEKEPELKEINEKVR